LPSSFGGNVKIETYLEFGEGSITWMGVVAVLDWVGRIVDTVTFVQLLSSGIEFAVNKVIAGEVTQYAIPVAYETISTRVIPEFAIVSQTDFLYRNLLLGQDEQVRILRGLSRNFDNLLRYIGQLQRRNSILRLPSYFLQRPNYPDYPYTQRPRQFPKDTLIVLVLLFLTIIQAINFFGLDTITGWFAKLFKATP